MKRHLAIILGIPVLMVVVFLLFAWYTQPLFKLPPDNSAVLNKTICDCTEEFRDIQEDYRSLCERHEKLLSHVVQLGRYAIEIDSATGQAFHSATGRLDKLEQLTTQQAKEIKDLKWATWGGCWNGQ